MSSCTKSNPAQISGIVDVYIAGSVNASMFSFSTVTYWKNSVPFKITDGRTYQYTNALAISGSDIYQGGCEWIGNRQYATIWKNYTAVHIGDTTTNATITSLAVVGNDVYAAGNTNSGTGTNITYWKNGVPHYLTSGFHYASSTGILISGADVYITGWVYGNSAGYWKNGIFISLTDATQKGETFAITSNGNDIYILGYSGPNVLLSEMTNMYWKNGVPVYIRTNDNFDVYSIAVSGTDVYVAGSITFHTFPVAAYWKNAVPVILGDLTYQSGGQSIAVDGTDVYVAGYAENGITLPHAGRKNSKVIYWKNGKPFQLTNGMQDAGASAVVLQKK